MSAASLHATGSGRVLVSTKPSTDNFLRHMEFAVVSHDDAADRLDLSVTFEVTQAPEIVGQLRAVADEIERWDGGRSAER